MKDDPRQIRAMYERMDDHFGDLGWWPAETSFEVMVGAVLTQNTSWRNVERAISRLKKEKLMDPMAVLNVDRRKLEKAIQCSGFFRVKAERLKSLCAFLREECGGDIGKLRRKPLKGLREKLLAIKGIGPETADSILLYALNKPIFVVDAYTRRIFTRHGIVDERDTYDTIQVVVMRALEGRVRRFNQYHALIVETAKIFCRTNPRCDGCPLGHGRGGKRS
ncbi:MAG: endonuclease III domain-containing protein [Candidatus Omnitrophica bacterium]|nr:endonuclease III domain-containing protein [Candidatus Omnitrophota bacterium]MDD5488060.1 endonuclease III domain-containing protein [Candidatus Omnitrophota bacterium]